MDYMDKAAAFLRSHQNSYLLAYQPKEGLTIEELSQLLPKVPSAAAFDRVVKKVIAGSKQELKAVQGQCREVIERFRNRFMHTQKQAIYSDLISLTSDEM